MTVWSAPPRFTGELVLGSNGTNMPTTKLATREGEVTSLREVDRLLRLAHDYRRVFPRGGYRGLNCLSLQVLLLVRRRQEVTVCDIATALHSARPTISNTVTHLSDEGFLIESRDIRDGRLRYQALSELGISVIHGFLSKMLAGEFPR